MQRCIRRIDYVMTNIAIKMTLTSVRPAGLSQSETPDAYPHWAHGVTILRSA